MNRATSIILIFNIKKKDLRIYGIKLLRFQRQSETKKSATILNYCQNKL